MNDLLTPDDLADRWRMPKKTILNWIYAGKLTFAVHLGRQWRFYEADVEAYERKQKISRKP